MPPKIARLAGLGAFGAIGGLVALFALIAWMSAPAARGGITLALSSVVWISLSIVFAALIGVHVYLGRQLILLSENRPTER
jgi:hypothetical protein